ncbi:MAG: DUF2147 domain-containing protein [Pseudomonadota bacterium]
MTSISKLRPINYALSAFCGLLVVGLLSANASARELSGVYNTGASGEEAAPAGTLDIEFHPCADDAEKICGTVVRINDDGPANDGLMPDGSPLLGFTMIVDLEDEGKGRFRDGKINAVDESLSKGKMVWYGVKVNVPESGPLEVKGCLAFICPRTMYWYPSDVSTATANDPNRRAGD